MFPVLSHQYYRFVPGTEIWPTGLYNQVAKYCTDKSILVEVGVGFGRSTCLMAELLHHYNKHPKFFAIDIFGVVSEADDGEPLSGLTPWGEDYRSWSARVGGDQRMIDHFDFYLAQSPCSRYLTDRVQCPPWNSSKEFDDASVYFLMLNASTKEASVMKQLQMWWPKIEMGGSVGVYGITDASLSNTVYAFGSEKGAELRGDVGTTVLVKTS